MPSTSSGRNRGSPCSHSRLAFPSEARGKRFRALPMFSPRRPDLLSPGGVRLSSAGQKFYNAVHKMVPPSLPAAHARSPFLLRSLISPKSSVITGFWYPSMLTPVHCATLTQPPCQSYITYSGCRIRTGMRSGTRSTCITPTLRKSTLGGSRQSTQRCAPFPMPPCALVSPP